MAQQHRVRDSTTKSRTRANPSIGEVSRSIVSIGLSRRVGTRQLEQSTGIPVCRPPDAILRARLVEARTRASSTISVRITPGYFPTGFSPPIFFHDQRRPRRPDDSRALSDYLDRGSTIAFSLPRNRRAGFREIQRHSSCERAEAASRIVSRDERLLLYVGQNWKDIVFLILFYKIFYNNFYKIFYFTFYFTFYFIKYFTLHFIF